MPTAGAKDGAWSNPATRGGAVAGEGVVVRIPTGKVVTLDGATARPGGLYVDGSLAAGPPGNPLTERFAVTLTGTDKPQNLMAMGTRLLGVMDGGKLALFGKDHQGWTQFGAHAAVGASSLALKKVPKGWHAGDQIVIAPSGFDAKDLDVVTISSVNGATVNFTPALKFAHWGEQENVEGVEGKTIDMRAALGLLTRNLKIQGDEASTGALLAAM